MLVEFSGSDAAQLRQMYSDGPFEAHELDNRLFRVKLPRGWKRFDSRDLKVLPSETRRTGVIGWLLRIVGF